MSINPLFQGFKSSGIYALEYDKSQTTNFQSNILRLVVGHSKKGPYNTPVFITNQDELRNIFGSIDKTLEKKGMYFHRTIGASLIKGPVLALNLCSFDDSDIAYASRIPTSSTKTDVITNEPGDFVGFFNRDKFQYPSDVNLIDFNNEGGKSPNSLLHFVNIKQEPITVIVRKAQDVKLYDVQAKEYWNSDNLPDYIDPTDFVSDYMIDVFVFKGEFNPAKMDLDPVYGGLFTNEGLLKNELTRFIELRTTELIGRYTGSVIPGFRDKEGRNLYIEALINSDYRRTGLFCAIDEEDLMSEPSLLNEKPYNKFDIVGHTTPSDPDFVFSNLSYKLKSKDREIRGVDELKVKLVGGGEVAGTLKLNPTNVENPIAGFTVTYTIDNNKSIENNSFPIKVGDYVKSDKVTSGDAKLARVIRVRKQKVTPDTTPGTSNKNVHVYNVDLHINTTQEVLDDIVIYKPFEEASSVYVPIVLKKAEISDKTITQCLEALADNGGLFKGLVDIDAIDYRYIVDSFGSFDGANGLINKYEITNIAKKRMNVSCIMNAPFVSEFKKSTEPSFKNESGKFSTRYVYDGGNLDMNPQSNWSLPSIEQGATYGYYYGPGLLFKEGYKDIVVPPAAYVANNYIDKFSSALPWSVVAGPRRGVVRGAGIVGAEYTFDKTDRDYLEPAGYNSIVFQKGVGLTIMANRTAQTAIQSTLSSAHAREALIYIHDGVRSILKDYIFEFNTPEVRLDIKTRVDNFLEGIKQNQGIYDYVTVCDNTNNTNEIIDNNMAVVSIFVEVVKAMEKIVFETTIFNTGEIQMASFS